MYMEWLINTYLKQSNINDKSKKVYANRIYQFLEYFDIHTIEDLSKIDRDHLVSYIYNSTQSVSSQKSRFFALKSFYQYLEENYDIANLLNDLKPPKPMRVKKREILNDTDIHKIRKAMRMDISNNKENLMKSYISIRNLILFDILTHTGLKASELVSVKKQDIKYYKNSIEIHIQTGVTRDIVLPKYIYSEWKYYMGIRNMYLNQENVYLFFTRNYEPISVRFLEQILGSYSKYIGKNISPQVLRAYYISSSYSANKGVEDISKEIGISNESISKYLPAT